MLTKISITVDMDNVLEEVLKLFIAAKEDHDLLGKYFADLAISMEEMNDRAPSEVSLRHFALDCHDLQEQMTMVETRLSDIKEIVAGYADAKFVQKINESHRDEDGTPTLDLAGTFPRYYDQEEVAQELLKSIEELGYD